MKLETEFNKMIFTFCRLELEIAYVKTQFFIINNHKCRYIFILLMYKLHFKINMLTCLNILCRLFFNTIVCAFSCKTILSYFVYSHTKKKLRMAFIFNNKH